MEPKKNNEDDHMELGDTGMWTKGTGFVDANGESFDYDDLGDDDVDSDS